MGVVCGLYVKPARRGPTAAVDRARLVPGHGIAGDANAAPLGPRQVLVVALESLEELGVEPGRLSVNIATRGLDDASMTPGSVLRMGQATRVRLTHRCEVCHVLRERVSPEVFRALPGRRGVLGVVLDGGPLAPGDRVRAEPDRCPPVPDGVYDRVAWVLARIPRGRVVTQDRLVRLVGCPGAYHRVMPTYLARAKASGLPAHRVLTTARRLSRHLPDQAGDLAAEGVGIADGALADEHRLWEGIDLYTSPGDERRLTMASASSAPIEPSAGGPIS